MVYKQEANYSNRFQGVQGYTSTHLLILPELDKICSLLYAAEHPYAKQPKAKVIKNLELLSSIRMLYVLDFGQLQSLHLRMFNQ